MMEGIPAHEGDAGTTGDSLMVLDRVAYEKLALPDSGLLDPVGTLAASPVGPLR